MDALEKMASLHPNLVLLDIQMPLLSGIELIQKARENGYEGEFIILSGFSDFQYAQAAIRYGVSCYLTKPIDETLLTQAVLSAKEKILSSLRTKDSYYRYMMKARNTVLADLLGNAQPDINIHYEEFGFTFPVYQIILYENLDTLSRFHFAEVFAAVCGPNDSFELLTLEGRNLLLLKRQFLTDPLPDFPFTLPGQAAEGFSSGLGLFSLRQAGLQPEGISSVLSGMLPADGTPLFLSAVPACRKSEGPACPSP